MKSFNTSSNKKEKQTALKLINKYADGYNLIIDENKKLTNEIKDLRSNLKINKEIIEGFFNISKSKDKTTFCIEKIKEENKKLYEQNEKLSKEIQILYTKINYNEQTKVEVISKEKEECEKLKNKLFLLEQLINKKDNIIENFKRKLDSIKNDEFSFLEREVYIIEPSKAVTIINDELLVYKQIYENIINTFEENRETIKKYDKMITDLQNENLKLRTLYKKHIVSANRERENLISEFKKEKYTLNLRTTTENGSKSINNLNKNKMNINISLNTNNINNNNTINNNNSNINSKNLTNNNLIYPTLTEDNTLCEKYLYDKKKKFENEEFVEILKAAGLSQHEFEKLSQNKNYTKLTEMIEMMYRLIKDKNMTINLVDKENESLIAKNFQLNKDNMKYFKKYMDLSRELKLIKNQNKYQFQNNQNNKTNDDSLINNTSKLNNPNTNNNSNQLTVENTINTYKKLLKTQINENEFGTKLKIDSASNANDIISNNGDNDNEYDSNIINNELSGHDSIVYTKNIKEDQQSLDYSNGRKDDNHIKKNDCQNINMKRINSFDSITSSEFKDGCGAESFMSTIKSKSTNNVIFGNNQNTLLNLQNEKIHKKNCNSNINNNFATDINNNDNQEKRNHFNCYNKYYCNNKNNQHYKDNYELNREENNINELDDYNIKTSNI